MGQTPKMGVVHKGAGQAVASAGLGDVAPGVSRLDLLNQGIGGNVPGFHTVAVVVVFINGPAQTLDQAAQGVGLYIGPAYGVVAGAGEIPHIIARLQRHGQGLTAELIVQSEFAEVVRIAGLVDTLLALGNGGHLAQDARGRFAAEAGVVVPAGVDPNF